MRSFLFLMAAAVCLAVLSLYGCKDEIEKLIIDPAFLPDSEYAPHF